MLDERPQKSDAHEIHLLREMAKVKVWALFYKLY